MASQEHGATPPAHDVPTPPGVPSAGTPASPGRPKPVARPRVATGNGQTPAQPRSAQPQSTQPTRPAPVPAQRGQGAARPIPVQQGSALPREVVEEEQPQTWEEWLRESPSWLVSAVVHMLLLVLLGVWIMSGPPDDGVTLESKFIADDLGEELEDDPVDLEVEEPVDESVLTPEMPIQVEDPFAAPPNVEVTLDGHAPTSDIAAPMIGLALEGRSEGMKKALLKKYGGNAQSEAAVKLALEWLARQQLQDGSWSLQKPYRDGGARENHLAATAMALLAFQGAGHTHKQGTYQRQVERGIQYLLSKQNPAGGFIANTTSHEQLYTHGQCAIAVCELYGMTNDPALKDHAQRAVDFCVENQDPELGGWRYTLRQDSDTSVTGWILMALQSARMSGLDVPETTLNRVGDYLDQAAVDGNKARYAYIPGAAGSEVMTAEALLCRQYLGWERNNEDLVNGVEYLLSNLPDYNNNRNVYYWYYATQTLHHMEGDYWTKWNDAMRDLLISKQQKAGQDKGSWHPSEPSPDHWGAHGGRLYTTCLSVYILEVYYRHLPIYSKVRF